MALHDPQAFPPHLRPGRGLSVLVTGGTAGIGAEITNELAAAGARVWFTGRHPEHGLARERELRAGGAQATYVCADLSTQDGVLALAREILQLAPKLDRLVNNVGGVFAEKTVNADGVEATFALNFLHPLLLSAALFPLLEASGGRIINVTTGYHLLVTLFEGDLAGRRWDCGMNVYGRAKLLALWVGRALAPLWYKRGVKLHFADPGMARTPLTKTMTPEYFPWYGQFLVPAIQYLQALVPWGTSAASALYLCLADRPGATTGLYTAPGALALPPWQAPWAEAFVPVGLRWLEKWLKPEYVRAFGDLLLPPALTARS